MSEESYSSGSQVVAESLAHQLGSDAKDLMRGRVDMRRLTVIEKVQLRGIMYAEIRKKKRKSFEIVLDVLKNWGPSIGGRGRRDIIRMEAVARGGSAAVDDEIPRPGFLHRNIVDRDWEKKAREEAGTV